MKKVLYTGGQVRQISLEAQKTARFSKFSMKRDCSTYEPPRGKTNNVVSEQVRHKSACTVTEKS